MDGSIHFRVYFIHLAVFAVADTHQRRESDGFERTLGSIFDLWEERDSSHTPPINQAFQSIKGQFTLLPFWFGHRRGVKRGEVSENPKSMGAIYELSNSLSAKSDSLFCFVFFF